MYQANRAEDLRERPLGELLKDLSEQTSTLVRDEIALARVEMTEKAKETGAAFGIMAVGGLVGFLALGVLSALFVIALNYALPLWVAALLVFVVYVAVAAALFMVGRNRMKTAAPPIPEATVQTLREDVNWAKHQANQGVRR